MFVWLRTDFSTKKVQKISLQKKHRQFPTQSELNSTDSLLEARDPKTFSLQVVSAEAHCTKTFFRKKLDHTNSIKQTRKSLTKIECTRSRRSAGSTPMPSRTDNRCSTPICRKVDTGRPAACPAAVRRLRRRTGRRTSPRRRRPPRPTNRRVLVEGVGRASLDGSGVGARVHVRFSGVDAVAQWAPDRAGDAVPR
jgi:hypothetical protein